MATGSIHQSIVCENLAKPALSSTAVLSPVIRRPHNIGLTIAVSVDRQVLPLTLSEASLVCDYNIGDGLHKADCIPELRWSASPFSIKETRQQEEAKQQPWNSREIAAKKRQLAAKLRKEQKESAESRAVAGAVQQAASPSVPYATRF